MRKYIALILVCLMVAPVVLALEKPVPPEEKPVYEVGFDKVFSLRVGEKAYVVDNDIFLTLNDIKAGDCPFERGNPKCDYIAHLTAVKNCKIKPCVETAKEIYLSKGQVEEVFGGYLELLKIDKKQGKFIIRSNKINEVKLGEEFKLTKGEIAKVVDYDNMEVKLLEIEKKTCLVTPCYPKATIAVTSGGCDTECSEFGYCEPCEIKTAILELEYGETKDYEDVVITYTKAEVTGKAPYIYFVVSNAKQLVDIEISPESQVMSKKKVVYEVTLKDKHSIIPIEICKIKPSEGIEISGFEAENKKLCKKQKYSYEIDVEGLPFKLKYPKNIELTAGEETTFEVVVYPKKSVISEKEDNIEYNKKYEFTVTATLQGDDNVRDTDNAVLIIKQKTPTPIKD